MGGLGSGNRFPRFKKYTVEDAWTVDVRDLRPAIRSRCSDEFTVTWGLGYCQASIDLSIRWDAVGPIITLEYSYKDEGISIPVRLESTPTNFYGERWWFTCPLIVAGEACERRAGKLYLPPRACYFGCRVCHDLTYLSCQATRPRRFRPHAA